MIGSSSFYRLDARMMAIPAAIDPNRRFRMDPDGFGLPTLLDDILGHEPERFIDLGTSSASTSQSSGRFTCKP